MQGTKEGYIPCGLPITVTGTYLYVEISICVCKLKKGKKEGRQAGDNPCGLADTGAGFCGYVRDTCISGRKETILVDYLPQIQISVHTLVPTS